MSNLPHGWGTATLSQLIGQDGVFSDGDWIESKDQDPNGATRLLQLADIGDGKFLDKSARFVNDATFERLRCTEVTEDDVLIARMPDPLGRACLAPKLPQRCITVVDVAIVRPGPQSVNPKWLMHSVNAPEIRESIQVQASGSTRQRIARGKLAEMPFPVPPKAEQNRIVDKLDVMLARVDACRDRLNRIPAILKRFRQSVLAAATSGAMTEDWREEKAIDKDWQHVRLADISDIQGGVTKDAKKQSVDNEEVPYLRVANVQRGYLDLREMKTIRVPESKLSGLLLEPGDVLFNEGGDIDKLGRGWVWEGQIDRCSFQNHVFRARLFDKSNQPKYISWWGNFRGLDFFLRSGKQTTNLASINKSMLSNLPISLPSPEEQAEIVRRVETLFAFADRLEARYTASRAQVEKLTPSLLAKAYRGALVSQDPSDEPASLLLDRIRAARAEASTEPRPSARRAGLSKIEVPMLTPDKNAPDYLTAILRRSSGHTLDAKALWQESQLSIPDFYEKLKAEADRGLLQEIKKEARSFLEAV